VSGAPYLELVCPAGTPASLRAAVDAGADTVYCGFRDETNARNFPGLNFDRKEMREGIAYAHSRGRKVLVAINTFPRAADPAPWRKAVDDASALGADAIILADLGLLDYAHRAHPAQRLHLSVQAAASNAMAIGFYRDRFGVRRVVLPRVLTVDEIAKLTAQVGLETEVFAFGGLCVMAEGRCALSSYLTGASPNSQGACAPASHVRYDDEDGQLMTRLGGVTINSFAKDEPAGYPTPCKGRFVADGKISYLFEDPVSLNIIDILPQLKSAGVTALKIEGRQRGRAYVQQVVSTFRAAIDALADGSKGGVAAGALNSISEGGRETTGAYRKSWR
jgi:collagenase-like PrtC family protease